MRLLYGLKTLFGQTDRVDPVNLEPEQSADDGNEKNANKARSQKRSHQGLANTVPSARAFGSTKRQEAESLETLPRMLCVQPALMCPDESKAEFMD